MDEENGSTQNKDKVMSDEELNQLAKDLGVEAEVTPVAESTTDAAATTGAKTTAAVPQAVPPAGPPADAPPADAAPVEEKGGRRTQKRSKQRKQQRLSQRKGGKKQQRSQRKQQKQQKQQGGEDKQQQQQQQKQRQQKQQGGALEPGLYQAGAPGYNSTTQVHSVFGGIGEQTGSFGPTSGIIQQHSAEPVVPQKGGRKQRK